MGTRKCLGALSHSNQLTILASQVELYDTVHPNYAHLNIRLFYLQELALHFRAVIGSHEPRPENIEMHSPASAN